MKTLLAPTGALRAVINLGNPVLAHADPRGQPSGVSVDLARALAHELELPLDLITVTKAADSVAAVVDGRADLGFFAIDPARGEQIAFTAPYVLIEGAYAVRQGSPIERNEEVDQAAHRVVVGQGSAYDLYLSRQLKAAHIVRAATGPQVVETFLSGGYEVAASVKQQLLADAQTHAGLRLLPGRFMVIEQAMGLPKSRGEAAHAHVSDFVERMKTNGFVATALARHGVQGADVAEPA